MQRKIFVIVLTLSLTIMLFPPLAYSVVGIPNPTKITYSTIGGPDSSCGTDPGGAYDTSSATLLQQVYEPLLMYNNMSVDEFIPMLSDSWPGYNWTGYAKPGNWIVPLHPTNATENATLNALGIHPPTLHIRYLGDIPTEEVWVFHIRKGVPWQNSLYGYLTPSDFVYTIQRDLLMDFPITGVQWLIYLPLSGGMYGNSRNAAWQTKAYTAAHGISSGNFSANLLPFVRNCIQCNNDYVWFNLPGAYPCFQQIITQCWAFCLCKAWCITQKCWNVGAYNTALCHFAGDDNYAEFVRCWHPATSPLVDPTLLASAEPAMGTGPYKLVHYNPDPHVGRQDFSKFASYWQGWSGNHADTCTIKIVEEWANRKAQFLSTSESLQCDLTDVPRANCPELHEDGNKDGDPLAGLSLTKLYLQTADYLYFTYTVNPTSLYVPKLGVNTKLDLFSDRDLRLGFMYSFNATQFLHDYFLGEAVTPPSFICNGTRFFNASTVFVRDIDIAKATHYFQIAWHGAVWNQGMTVDLVYNTGNLARYTIASMLADVIMNRIPWPNKNLIHVIPTAEPWSDFTVDLAGNLPVFAVGWIADYPDPSDWSSPFLDTNGGVYATWQSIEYGLNATDMYANWPSPANYPHPPFTDPFGTHVTEINNTYVSDLVIKAATTADQIGKANASYQEMMDIFYAEAATLPTDQGLARHYERDWVHGWKGGYSNNPVAVGDYFYQMWKAVPSGYTVYGVDVSAAGSITNTTKAYPLIQNFHGEMRLNGKPAKINFTLHITSTSTVAFWATVDLFRNSTTGTYYFPIILNVTLFPTSDEYAPHVTWYENGTMTDGNYTLYLHSDPAGTAGGIVYDTDPTNNQVEFTQSPTAFIVRILSWPFDLNGDGEVNMKDVRQVAKAFGSYEGHPRWDPFSDVNGDEKVDMKDVRAVAKLFGRNFLTLFK